MLMFNAYFASKLYYGIELIGCADNTLINKLQNGQSMFSHPHCIVELLGAFIEFTVKLEASPAPYNESTSMCPERNWPEMIKNYHFQEKSFRHIHKFKKKTFFS